MEIKLLGVLVLVCPLSTATFFFQYGYKSMVAVCVFFFSISKYFYFAVVCLIYESTKYISSLSVKRQSKLLFVLQPGVIILFACS